MTITTTTTAVPITFPFTGLPDLTDLERSRLPRGSIFFNAAQTILSGEVGDDQLWVIDCNIPRNYAYTLSEVHVRLDGTTTSLVNWDLSASARFFGPTADIPFDGINSGDSMITTTTDRRHFTFPEMPKAILLNPTGIDITVGNNTLDDAAMTGTFFIGLYQYDISQAHHVLVNTPQFVR